MENPKYGSKTLEFPPTSSDWSTKPNELQNKAGSASVQRTWSHFTNNPRHSKWLLMSCSLGEPYGKKYGKKLRLHSLDMQVAHYKMNQKTKQNSYQKYNV